MTEKCPFCLSTDLPDGARKCRHCGSWLDETQEPDLRGAVRSDIRDELHSDLTEHRGLVETMLKRLQTVGGIIIGAALGAALFFGYTTDKSISDTSDRIAQNAATKIEAAASEITDKAREQIRTVVTEKMESAETRKMIDEVLQATLTERVRTAVDERMEPIAQSVNQQIESSGTQLQQLESQMASLEAQSTGASDRLATIQASFEGAQEQTVKSADILLPTDLIRVEEKGGPDQLVRMLEEGVDALSYQLGGYYYGPMVWRYFDALKALPQFRHVLILTPDGRELIGVLDAATLSAFLDPPNTVELHENLGPDLYRVPNEEDVPGWTDFARWLSDGEVDRLRALPSFRRAGEPVHLNDSSLLVLSVMEQRRADLLPVVDDNDRFAGVVERSRLTARILLEIAAPRS